MPMSCRCRAAVDPAACSATHHDCVSQRVHRGVYCGASCRSLASRLQSLSSDFRACQKDYLSQLKQFKDGGVAWRALVGEDTPGDRESKREVDTVRCPRAVSMPASCVSRRALLSAAFRSSVRGAFSVWISSLASWQGFNTAQSMELMTAEELAQERDAEIRNIVTSIHELAAVFKELAVMVIEQGTVIDRIDYNMEQVRPAARPPCCRSV